MSALSTSCHRKVKYTQEIQGRGPSPILHPATEESKNPHSLYQPDLRAKYLPDTKRGDAVDVRAYILDPEGTTTAIREMEA